MPRDHSHGCGSECNDHDHIPEAQGHRDNLYTRIDRDNIVALNAEGRASSVIKPWNERMGEEVYLESDADDQLILRIPFTGSVKLRALLLKAGPGDQTPAKVSLYSNADALDFSEISDQKPTQEFEVPQGREVGEYHVMSAKFPATTSITLFFPASQGADTIRIYYVGFLGQWSERKSEPIIAVYESRGNPADHLRLRGLQGATAP
ncbi:galactose-binding domain-like protein [Irpex rosettiformis]|uniref:Galactose-binding domain-like protein n=1 Tax=Irpex rosettiformis TaxID=378272 RepID=A0ACB8TQ33_9APHY|nr:galactose-binding domain-like protein [Irpex rosettiformis]